jgi:hypothetical protein
MANGTRRDTATGEYLVPAKLVHWAIVSILSAIFAVAGYMVVWAVADNGHKAGVLTRVSVLERDIADLKREIRRHEDKEHD